MSVAAPRSVPSEEHVHARKRVAASGVTDGSGELAGLRLRGSGHQEKGEERDKAHTRHRGKISHRHKH